MQPYVPALKLPDEKIDIASGATRMGGVFGAVVVGLVVAVVNMI
jgi:hypothetical protein